MDPLQTGQLIAELRKKKGINQTELAQLLNISNRTVSKWENGDGFPDISLLPDIASVLGTTTDELLAGKQNVIENEPNIPTFIFEGKDGLKPYIIMYKKVQRDKMPLWCQIVITICVTLCFLFMIGLVVSSFGSYDNIPIGLFAFCVIIMLFSILSPYIAGWAAYKNQRAFNNDKSVADRIVVSDKIYFDKGTYHREYAFSDITDFSEYKGYYILKIHKRVFAAFNKTELVNANNYDFETYIRSVITPKKKKKFTRIFAIILAVILFIETIVVGGLFYFTVDFDSMTYNTMSMEEVVEKDNDKMLEIVSQKVQYKVGYDEEIERAVLSSLNQTELNFYYVYTFYVELDEASLINYLCNYNWDLPYLSGALVSVGLEDIAKEVNKCLSDNNIDIIEFSKIDYPDWEEMEETLDQSSFIEYSKNHDVKNIIREKLVEYVKTHSQDFE